MFDKLLNTPVFGALFTGNAQKNVTHLLLINYRHISHEEKIANNSKKLIVFNLF